MSKAHKSTQEPAIKSTEPKSKAFMSKEPKARQPVAHKSRPPSARNLWAGNSEASKSKASKRKIYKNTQEKQELAPKSKAPKSKASKNKAHKDTQGFATVERLGDTWLSPSPGSQHLQVPMKLCHYREAWRCACRQGAGFAKDPAPPPCTAAAAADSLRAFPGQILAVGLLALAACAAASTRVTLADNKSAAAASPGSAAPPHSSGCCRCCRQLISSGPATVLAAPLPASVVVVEPEVRAQAAWVAEVSPAWVAEVLGMEVAEVLIASVLEVVVAAWVAEVSAAWVPLTSEDRFLMFDVRLVNGAASMKHAMRTSGMKKLPMSHAAPAVEGINTAQN
eukprot:1150620-Pelagomonas_calceolata.AAC.3